MRTLALALAALILLVIVSPLFAPYDPARTDTTRVMQPPSSEHLLGTDSLGRDVLSRVLYGGQRTLLVAALATLVAVLPGMALGLLAGARQGWLDVLITTLLNALLAFPGLLLALVALALLGAGGMQLALATGAALIAQYARVTRSAVIALRSAGYVDAARAAGAPGWWVITRHVLPNIAPTQLAYAAVIFSYSVLNGAALSFLGLGGDLGAPDWGTMLYEGRVAFRAAPWISVAPGVAISAIVLAINTLTDRFTRRAV